MAEAFPDPQGRGGRPTPSQALQNAAVEDYSKFAPRPDFGAAGNTTKVLANMFETSLNGPQTIYHYDVQIAPVVKTVNEKVVKNLAFKIWLEAVKNAPPAVKPGLAVAAFDLVCNAYTPHRLPTPASGKGEIIVSLATTHQDNPELDRRRFRVTIQLVNSIDLTKIMQYCAGPLGVKDLDVATTAIQAINVLLRHQPQLDGFNVTHKGKKFIGLEGAVPIPGGGVVNYGFMQSLRPTQSGKPAIQLDTAYSACLQPGPLIPVIEGILGIGGASGARGGRGGARGGPPGPPGRGAGLVNISDNDRKRLMPLLKFAKFKVSYRQCPEPFSISGITRDAAQDCTFLLDNPQGGAPTQTDVVTYFRNSLNVTVNRPRLPCITYGNPRRPAMVPLEFVVLEPFNKISVERLTGEQAAAMIKVTAKPPPERKNLINERRAKLDYNALPKIKAWGLHVESKMTEVEARILPPPQVQYGQGRSLTGRGGFWNIRNMMFHTPGQTLRSWAVVSFDPRCDHPAMKDFISKLIRVLIDQGVNVETRQPPLFIHDPQREGPAAAIENGLREAAKAAYMQSRQDPQLIICIRPYQDLHFYEDVKKFALESMKAPVVTQIVQSAKFKNPKGSIDPYLGNLAMKIHAKLGGITHSVKSVYLDNATMMVGADVSHPTGRGSSAIQPSIAVTVASTGGQSLPKHCIRLQEGRKEMITDFGDMLKNHIKAFEAKQKAKPKKIIVFRDGVSEGQYSQVVEYELSKLRVAAKEMDPGYNPKVTFIVCAKRHHMRFFATKDQDKDRTGNLQAGLVVDRGVTHPFAFDFYLQAHAGLQGTAKPTHYVVVVDDNGFKADQMQTMVNEMSYTYLRLTRAVSLAPMAYYADIIAGKCRSMVYTDDDASSTAPSTMSGGQRPGEFDPLKLKRRLDDANINNVAWYM